MALNDALSRLGWSQTELAQKANITQPQANRACRGKAVGIDTFQAIAHALPEDYQGNVTAAWVKDLPIGDLLDTIDVVAASTRLQEVPRPELPAELDHETRELVLWLAHQAVRNTAVRDALRSLKRVAGAVSGATSKERARTPGKSDTTRESVTGPKVAERVTSERARRAADGLAELASRNPATLAMMEEHLRLTSLTSIDSDPESPNVRKPRSP